MTHRLLLLEPPAPNQITSSDSASGVEAFSIEASFTIFDSGLASDRLALGPRTEIQNLVLPQVQSIRKIVNLTLGLAATPSRGIQYGREIANKGDTYEISGLTDRATLEQLFALAASGTVWVADAERGSFHADLEIAASWAAADAPQLERTV